MTELSSEAEVAAGKIASTVTVAFGASAVVLGFGSFWQAPLELRPGSDIDYLIFVPSCPKEASLNLMADHYEEFALEPGRVHSPQLIVGPPSSLTRGSANLTRLMHMYRPWVSPPKTILGNPVEPLLNCVGSSDLRTAFADELFQLTRLWHSSRMIRSGTERWTRDLWRLSEAVISAQMHFGSTSGISGQAANQLAQSNCTTRELIEILHSLVG